MPSKAKLVTRSESTTSVVADNIPKNAGLSNAELDSNFLNLRDQSFGLVGDDSTGIDVQSGQTLTVTGTGGITVAVANDTVTIDGSAVSGGGGGGDIGNLQVNDTTLSPITTNDNLSLQANGTGKVNVESLSISGNTITTSGNTPLDIDHDGNGEIRTGEFTVTEGLSTTPTEYWTFNTEGIGNANLGSVSSFKMSGTSFGSDTSSDLNILELYFKKVNMPNHNVTFTIGNDGNIKFQATAGTPHITIYENNNDGKIEIMPKAGKEVFVDGIQIKDNTISSNDSNADLELDSNGSGNIVISGLRYPTTDGTNGQVLTTNGSGTLSFQSVEGAINIDGGTADSTYGAITAIDGGDATT